MPDLQSARWNRIAVVSLAGQGIDDGGLQVGLVFRAMVSEQVVNQPCSGALQEGVRIGVTVSKKVGGAVVRLYTSATFFFTESGAIEIGKEITGPDGVAIFEYVPSRSVTTEVRAEYQGDDSYGPSHSTASFEVYGDRQLIQTHAGIQVSFINKWLLGGILIIIWSLYLFVVSRILRIAQAPPE